MEVQRGNERSRIRRLPASASRDIPACPRRVLSRATNSRATGDLRRRPGERQAPVPGDHNGRPAAWRPIQHRRRGPGHRTDTRAARDLLDALDPADRRALTQPVDAEEWRRWTNAYPVWAPHGILLEDASQRQRDAVLDLVSACMSARGARETRDCMRLNTVLGQVVPYYPGTLTEWMYRFSLFGVPSPDRPWGWQLAGHHLDLHCFILGRQMVFTPAFYGAEPRISDRAPYPGIRLFDAEIDRGRELLRSLDGPQRGRAVLYSSMLSRDLPPNLKHPTEGSSWPMTSPSRS